MAWLIFFISVLLSIIGAPVSAKPVQAVQGSTFTLTCSFVSISNDIIWKGPYHGSTIYVTQAGQLNTYLPKDLHDRISVNKDSAGKSHLRIVNVQNIDIGAYECSIKDQGNVELFTVSFSVLISSSQSSYFRSLLIDSNTQRLIVGSMNYVNIIDISESLTSNHPITNITFDPKKNDNDYCKLSKPETPDCQNHMRIIAKNVEDSLILCGTNAYAPQGYILNLTDGSKFESGSVPCSDDPLDNFTAIYSVSSNTNSQGNLYYGATTNSISLISRQILKADGSVDDDIEGVNSNKWMNNPQFAGSFEIDDEVFFFFREIAIEVDPAEYRRYPRVAKVCKKDQGGSSLLRDKWTTYQKARLKCSIPGEFPTYFDVIQDVVIRDSVFYGLFTAGTSRFSVSAICAYHVSDVKSVLEGSFKEQANSDSFWKEATTVPSPRPGQCTNNSLSVPNDVLQFIVDHPLMHQTVQPLYGKPIFILENEDLQRLELHNNITELVFYAASNRGNIYKVFSKNESSYISTNYTLDDVQQPIWSIKHHGDYVYVATDNSVRQIKVVNCEQYKWIDTCVKDPHCAWDNNSHYLTDTNEENEVQCYNRCISISALSTIPLTGEIYTHKNVDLSQTFPYTCPPGRPRYLHVIDTTTTNVHLKWFAYMFVGTGLKFYIEFRVSGNWNRVEVILQGSEKDPQYHLLANLEQGCLYEIRVCATNNIGDSSATQSITVSTKGESRDSDREKGLYVSIGMLAFIVFILLIVIICWIIKDLKRKKTAKVNESVCSEINCTTCNNISSKDKYEKPVCLGKCLSQPSTISPMESTATHKQFSQEQDQKPQAPEDKKHRKLQSEKRKLEHNNEHVQELQPSEKSNNNDCIESETKIKKLKKKKKKKKKENDEEDKSGEKNHRKTKKHRSKMSNGIHDNTEVAIEGSNAYTIHL